MTEPQAAKATPAKGQQKLVPRKTVTPKPKVLAPEEARAKAMKAIVEEAQDSATIALAEYARQLPEIMRSKAEPTSNKSKAAADARKIISYGFKDDNEAEDAGQKVYININVGGDTPPIKIVSEVPRKIEDKGYE
jgi:hypothetical protein